MKCEEIVESELLTFYMKTGSSKGTKVAIIVSVTVGVGMIFLGVSIFLLRRRKRKQNQGIYSGFSWVQLHFL